MDELSKLHLKLTKLIQELPVTDRASINIETVNNAPITICGINNIPGLCIDLVSIGPSISTRWVIQDRNLSFMISKGGILLRFKAKENIYKQYLKAEQSILMPAGTPFMLRTEEKKCSMLIIHPDTIGNGGNNG